MQFLKYFIIFVSLFTAAQPTLAGCKNLQPPYMGKVRFVTVGEDYKVRKVTVGENIRIKLVKTTPTHCGEWRQVTSGEDFKVRFVEVGEDIKINLSRN